MWSFVQQELTLSRPSSKRTFSQPFKRKYTSEAVRIGSIRSKQMKSQVLHTVWCYIFLVRLQGWNLKLISLGSEVVGQDESAYFNCCSIHPFHPTHSSFLFRCCSSKDPISDHLPLTLEATRIRNGCRQTGHCGHCAAPSSNHKKPFNWAPNVYRIRLVCRLSITAERN